MIRVFLVDDHEIVRRGVADLIESDPELTVTGEASSAAQALARVPALRPDVVILDVRLPDGNGIELCRDLRAKLPELAALILTSYTNEEAMLDAVLAGAGGYVIKDIQGMRLLSAIHEVAEGRSLLDTRAAATLMDKLRQDSAPSGPLAQLSQRERDLLELIGEGLTNRQISERMFLAEKTVKNYVSRLLGKLDMERRTQAAVLATELRKDRQDGERNW
ncbi:LuxR family two component transcriptional regulator [Tamaricihabitans halophyticus]|uniref:LuxR family two component transcriptional regulator n=1 Tax=Tamaricihabitans halophyticus TaxID=1262583 RepID=A0A4R2QGR9_9PSEU|nr:response regulator transcription factor [Tamaricihabitans halophyticus]TCP47899.1 LuxR family two component transcriptional regulator [Tamaricihabitans halophyticus]